MYPGHHQPKLPADLGYYDMRVPETRAAQSDLARRYGIEAFCYWHYWFAGREVLERPVQEILASGKPDFPFCLAWANASWTGIWYGTRDKVLLEQTYPGPDDHERHFEAILPALLDPRYLRVEDRPLLVVFQPMEIPNVQDFCKQWRELAAKAGLKGLHLVGFGTTGFVPRDCGFDASILHGPRLPHPHKGHYGQQRFWHRLLRIPAVSSYRSFVRRGFPTIASDLDYPVAIPNWDNTPRAGRAGSVLHGATPELFATHLRQAISRVSDRAPDKRIVFLKSWNEWAEGNYLEPDQRYGRAFLEAIREVYDEMGV